MHILCSSTVKCEKAASPAWLRARCTRRPSARSVWTGSPLASPCHWRLTEAKQSTLPVPRQQLVPTNPKTSKLEDSVSFLNPARVGRTPTCVAEKSATRTSHRGGACWSSQSIDYYRRGDQSSHPRVVVSRILLRNSTSPSIEPASSSASKLPEPRE